LLASSRFTQDGLEIAGRKFQFLAYSNSSLKEHAVWFVTPFRDENGRRITADVIRSSLGNFDKVIRCPARFGARMSQAFTSTSVSISIPAEEVIQLPDIKTMVNDKPVVFTDGIGTCSRHTMDAIAGALRESTGGKKKNRRHHAYFSAVQVRLAGNKGMLIVDHTLSDDTIFVRDSMNKFILDYESLDVEIADVFDHPKPMFLNRPLIMILETLGVPIPSFVDLQKVMIASITSSTHRMELSAQLLATHGLGTAFRIPSVLLGLAKMGLASPPPEDKFLARGLNYAVNHVLRCLKHRARIHVPDSWTLVGVADFHRYLGEGEVFGTLLVFPLNTAINAASVQCACGTGMGKRNI
jgi:RNA-dependent RNA polymerase